QHPSNVTLMEYRRGRITPQYRRWGRALREAGHDVVAIGEVARGATDEQVLERAVNESARSSRRIGTLANWYMRVAGRRPE
ncbi:MAG: hypothetical protein WBB89_06240, partial [Candidatus Acidiferrum sp.]